MKPPNIQTQIKRHGGIKAFSDHLKIPYRTVQDWHAGTRRPPAWLPALIRDALKWRKEKDEG